MTRKHPDKQPLLSICIPTYNFGKFIGDTLESIRRQSTVDVEVIVLDSGSTDNTPSIVRNLQRDFHELRYVRADTKGGIDRDIARVIDLASGTYCWLFSADDVMKQGAIATILKETESQDDVYLCMHSNNALNMDLIDARHPVLACSARQRFELGDPRTQIRYFRLALTTEAFFSFMGTIIVRRAKWTSIPLNERFTGSCWAHAVRLFELAGNGGLSVTFVPIVLVERRAGNDSFMADGVVKRYALGIEGYQAVAEHFWGGASEHAYHVRRVLRREFSLGMLLSAKTACATSASRENMGHLDRMVSGLHSDRSVECWARQLIYRLFPTYMYRPLRALYRLLFLRDLRGR